MCLENPHVREISWNGGGESCTESDRPMAMSDKRNLILFTPVPSG